MPKKKNRTLTFEADYREKILGQFYSDHMLATFIINLLTNKDSHKMLLDPSCGDGIFLQTYLNCTEFNKLPPKTVYGWDIDKSALEKAQIHCGNHKSVQLLQGDALIPQPVFNQWLASNHVNLAFDYIVGNPPFVVINSRHKQYLEISRAKEYQILRTSNYNTASLFIFRYAQLLSPDGQLIFIFPRSLLHVNSFAPVRAFLLQFAIEYLFDLGRAFPSVGLEQIIIGIRKTDSEKVALNWIHYGLLNKDPKSGVISEILTYQIPQKILTSSSIFSVFEGQKKDERCSGSQILTQMKHLGKHRLEEFCINKEELGIEPVFRGIGWQRIAKKKAESSQDWPVIGGRSLFNFGLKNSIQFIPSETLFHTKSNQATNIKISVLTHYPKIVIQNLVSSKIRLIATYISQPIHKDNEGKARFVLTFDTITNIISQPQYVGFLLALFTSELITYYLRDFIFLRQTLTLHIDKKYLQKIPIPLPTSEILQEINQIIDELTMFTKQAQLRHPVGDREKPSWESAENVDFPQYKRLTDKLDGVIYDLYQILPEERIFIQTQLQEFEELY